MYLTVSWDQQASGSCVKQGIFGFTEVVNWNGTQGRLLCWYPEKAESGKALQSSYPELFARFVK